MQDYLVRLRHFGHGDKGGGAMQCQLGHGILLGGNVGMRQPWIAARQGILLRLQTLVLTMERRWNLGGLPLRDDDLDPCL